MLGQDEMFLSSAIHQGDAVNEIVAECIGDQLVLHVNGELVDDVRDGTFVSGDVGLMAGTYEKVGVDIRFDNFAVYRP
jgi:hypothetical protein